jgi:CheY-like chemotaxis protein
MSSPSFRKILLVDDDQEILFIARMALESLGGFSVCTCGSGREALQRAMEFAPDLIVLDVMMPEMDGPAVLRALRLLPGLRATPVIFLTGLSYPAGVHADLGNGILGVISKPFDPISLPDRIRQLVQT